tara:strand:- start:1621 stop:1806 length:186 start_codon:yes stop_codon:yes gene_type:complete
MSQEDLNKMLEIRKSLVLEFENLRDYKQNPNALMKEADHAVFIGKTINKIDEFLGKYVQFS